MTARLACLGGLTGARAVHIHGFPFLDQVASGHYEAVTATADGIRGAGRLTDLSVTFRDLRMPPLSGLVGRPSQNSVTVGSIVIAATIRLAGFGLPAFGLLANEAAAGAMPFPGHLDAVTPVPGGARITLSVPGAGAGEAAGRFDSGCAAPAGRRG